MDLSSAEIQKAKSVFSIYDFEGTDKIDGVNLADCLRALDLTPSLKTIGKLGGTKQQGEKKFSIEEFLSVYSDAKKDKDVGCLEDYVEILKLYDKYDDGFMPVNQLQHMLLATGERMENDSVQLIMKECCDPPDEDGMIQYLPFIKKVCKGPLSPFDSMQTTPAAPTPTQRMRPSINVDDADAPSVSFAAAKPMVMPEDAPVSFTLKAPRRSSSISPVPESIEANL